MKHRQRRQHGDDAPIGARRSGKNGLWRIERPAGAGDAAHAGPITEEQNHNGKQIDVVADHVDEREHHVACSKHQRNQIVAEAA